MRLLQTGIIFIGSVCAGKSTQGKLIAEAIGKESVSVDDVANEYYQAAGFQWSQFEKSKQENGFLEAYQQLKPFEADATRQILKDYPECVIDFGAGHSYYEDNSNV